MAKKGTKKTNNKPSSEEGNNYEKNILGKTEVGSVKKDGIKEMDAQTGPSDGGTNPADGGTQPIDIGQSPTITITVPPPDPMSWPTDGGTNPTDGGNNGNDGGSGTGTTDQQGNKIDACQKGANGMFDNKGFVLYDGKIKFGGSTPWRNNNPGDLHTTSFAINNGAYPDPDSSNGQSQAVAVFPDYDTGFAAMLALLQTSKYNGKTLDQIATSWVGPWEPNRTDWENNVISICNSMGLTLTSSSVITATTMTTANLNTLGTAIGRAEGAAVTGTTYDANSPNAPDWAKNLLQEQSQCPK